MLFFNLFTFFQISDRTYAKNINSTKKFNSSSYKYRPSSVRPRWYVQSHQIFKYQVFDPEEKSDIIEATDEGVEDEDEYVRSKVKKPVSAVPN